MGIRNSDELVKPYFKTDRRGNPTGGQTLLDFGSTDEFSYIAMQIDWQHGIVGDDGQTGAFVEDVITAAIQRLEFFNSTKFRCRENSLAITKLQEALHWLDHRTTKRVTQGVENTYEVHDS